MRASPEVGSRGLGDRRLVLRNRNGGGEKRREQVGARYADGTPHPREAAKARDTTPTHLTKNAPPLSSGSALHWPRPLPHPPPLIVCRSRPSSISPSPLAPLPRYPLREFFIGVGHTLSFVTRLRLVSGLLPSRLSFILHVVLGAWGMGVDQIRPCPRGVKGMVGEHGSRLRQ